MMRKIAIANCKGAGGSDYRVGKEQGKG